ncbi:MAG: putative phosphatidate cytidylyltransferase [Chloroflexi bacterium]|nr:putative phosphatidate cytidylyltransferase [Chloroflexota bacterium]
MLSNNWVALIITFGLALGWLRLNDYLAHRGFLSSHLSRKIIHVGTGPIFVICWLLFNDAPIARYLAALVPLAFTLQFLLIGVGIIKDEASVQAMSRTGDRREILRGPLYYGIIFVVLTILYWVNSPIGMVALMLMCGGDGLADIFGRRYGSHKIPWNRQKSWIGSLSMFFGGLIFAILILIPFITFDYFNGPISSYLPKLALIALLATLVESLPIHDLDNLTITLTAVIAGELLL